MKLIKPFLLFLFFIFLISGKNIYYSKIKLDNKLSKVTKENNFIWGIAGHPSSSGYPSYQYKNISAVTQVKLVQEMGASFYRLGVRLNKKGDSLLYNGYKLFEAAKENNIKILPVIHLKIKKELNKKFSLKLMDSIYLIGKLQGNNLSKILKGNCDYFELGNEEALKKGIKEKGKLGDKKSVYNVENMLKISAYYKGLIEGLKYNIPKAKIIINSTWLNYSFFDILIENGVNFDIIGYHWYSEMGKLKKFLPKLNSYNKDIWITELDKRNGSINKELKKKCFNFKEKFLPYSEESEQANIISNYIDELKEPYAKNVKALFIYELLDINGFAYKGGVCNASEAFYGLVKWPNYNPITKNHRKFELKEAAKELKYKIQEFNKK